MKHIAGSSIGWRPVPDWLATDDGRFLPNRTSWEWIKRQHRARLLKSGQWIPGKGRRPDLVGPKIGAVVLKIWQQESAKAAL